jgi:hypothetical protein
MRTLTTHAFASIALAIVVAFPDESNAQRRNRGDNSSFGVPVATNTVLANPDAYKGRPVTLSAGVEQVLSKTAFVIDQQQAAGAKEIKAVGKPMLVIAPYLTGSINAKQYLLMRGQVVMFDPATLGQVVADYTLDLAPEVSAKYQGLPVLVATSVLDSKYKELASKPAPLVPAAPAKASD